MLTGESATPGGPASWQLPARAYRTLTVGLAVDRAPLCAALNARVDRMVADGLADEVRGLLAAGCAASLPAMQGIGYRHLAPVIQGHGCFPDALSAMKRDTRRYAKRQGTWFAREENVQWIPVEPGRSASIADRIKKLVDRTRLFD